VRRAGTLLALTGLLAGCGGSSHHKAPGKPIPGAKVAVIVLHDQSPKTILRSGWLATAAAGGGKARMSGEARPDQPYLVMLSGQTPGPTGASLGIPPLHGPDLPGQLDRANVSWKAYMEGMPSPCFGRTSATDVTGLYSKAHDPFLFYADVAGSAALCKAHVVPGTQLTADIRANALPRFAWITPNTCEDGQTCPVARTEQWLAQTVPPLVKALGPEGVVFITGDDSPATPTGGGRLPLVALGSEVRPHSADHEKNHHRALLATIEDVLGLGRLATTHDSKTLRALLRN
jgi:hypothetical protein